MPDRWFESFQQFKNNAGKAKKLEEDLARVTKELSAVKKENLHLNEQLHLKQTSLAKFQEIVQDLVEIQGKYSSLLMEKKAVDEELAQEKMLRLALEVQMENDKTETALSLRTELQTLREDATAKETQLEKKYMAIIANQKEEIELMKLDLEKMTNQHKKEIFEENRPLESEKKGLTLLQKCTDSIKGTWIPPSKNKEALGAIVVEPPKKDIYTFREEETKAGTTDMITKKPVNKIHSINPNITSKPYTTRVNSSSLEVLRLPSRITKKSSPIKRKRKLYSRSDDMI